MKYLCVVAKQESEVRHSPASLTPPYSLFQVPKAVEELCETTPPAGQQPQGQAAWQAEADAERGGLREGKHSLMLF